MPPTWIAQLALEGRIVVPLRMRTLTRCLTLQRRGDHLVATTALQCGFVPLCRSRHNGTYADLVVMPMGPCG
ncbi:hypothetical protein [Actinoplanes xinjiangensis]|uniref:hypothetical protein n=1 Tax=Actinoplanes xinjiangensis TaxID=512350 RepID=UPI0023B22C91|nr:hypothetical protein [Actinoplanes xinjiangensis]